MILASGSAKTVPIAEFSFQNGNKSFFATTGEPRKAVLKAKSCLAWSEKGNAHREKSFGQRWCVGFLGFFVQLFNDPKYS
jgi:hypothetical protein